MPITSAITRRSQRHRNRQRHHRHSLSRKRSYAHTRRTRRWAKRKVCRRGGVPPNTGLHEAKTNLTNKIEKTIQIKWAIDDRTFYCAAQYDLKSGYIPCKNSAYEIIPDVQLYLHTNNDEDIIKFLNSGSFSTKLYHINFDNNWWKISTKSDQFIKKKSLNNDTAYFIRTYKNDDYRCYFALDGSKPHNPNRFYCLMMKPDEELKTEKIIPDP